MTNITGLKEAEVLADILDDLPLADGLENMDMGLLTSYIVEAGYWINFFKSIQQTSAIRLVCRGMMIKRGYTHIDSRLYSLTRNLLDYHRDKITDVLQHYDYDAPLEDIGT